MTVEGVSPGAGNQQPLNPSGIPAPDSGSPSDGSRGSLIRGVLSRIPGVSITDEENLIVMLAWMMNEGSHCNFNPYGCEKKYPGSTQCKYVTTATVQAYPDFATGCTAMAAMIQQGWVTDIVGALRSTTMTAEAKANIIGMAGWNTGPNSPTTTVAGRNAYRITMLSHVAAIRLDLQSNLEEPLPGGSVTNASVVGAAVPERGLSLGLSLGGLTSWEDGLKTALGFLTTPDNWWRIGRVTLGGLLVAVGLVVVFGDIKGVSSVPGVSAGVKIAKAVS